MLTSKPNAAQLYDSRVRDLKTDIEFLKRFCEKSSILEVGCGTGRILRDIALSDSYRCVGVELDSDKLKICRERLNKTNIELINTNFLTLTSSQIGKFDRVLFSFNVLAEFLGPKIRRHALMVARSLLTEGGKIFITLPAPNDSVYLKPLDVITKKFPHNGTDWTATFTITRDLALRRSTILVNYTTSDNKYEVADHYQNEYISREELIQHYQHLDLDLEEEFGDFEHRSQVTSSSEMIHILKVKSKND